jgi:crotonobetainyl-CoA:carnitine CoA-transferase CaiB-like acyl-CoA transferase
MKHNMLEGVRIADLTTVIFGPYCTQMLADLGADVVKVEPPEGDSCRLIGTPAKTPKMGPSHMRLNRGKRSVVWDLKSEIGRTAMRKLIETSDVFIHNIRADAIQRMGMTYEGFHSSGPYAGLQAYDDIIQAGAGVASLLPLVDGNPQPRYLPMAMADKVSGLHAAYAVLAALFHRQRTGEGQRVEVPMLESVASFTLLEHLGDITFQPPTGTSCYKRQIDPSRQPLKTKNGYISIAPYLENRWARLFAAAGRQDVIDGAKLDFSGMGSPKDMNILYDHLREITPSRTTADWLSLCKKTQVPAMQVNSIDDLLVDPHLNKVGMFKRRMHPSEGEYIEVQSPVDFSARPYVEVRHPPHIGEHTLEVLKELGVLENE